MSLTSTSSPWAAGHYPPIKPATYIFGLMEYFSTLLQLLYIERDAEKQLYKELIENTTVAARRDGGLTWYPIAIKGTETGIGDYITVEVERTTHTDIIHQLRFGMSAALFSNHNPREDRLEGTITYINNTRLNLALRTDELPEWTRSGKLGIDLVFDAYSYQEMETAIKLAATLAGQKNEQAELIDVLLGKTAATFSGDQHYNNGHLNPKQQEAVNKILAAETLAIVHGPPGTGKTTTIVQAIKALLKGGQQQILVVAPSNTAVDLLSEKLTDQQISVTRIGNPARVSERLLSLTLDFKLNEHPASKEIKRLKKQATAYRDMAQKYKRSFGASEREQRKALFAEARNIGKEIQKTEQYIADQVIGRSQVIAATLAGANHYTVRQLRYTTVVIDEAGQALEPACWIPVLKGKKVIMAGDHLQLPPTIKSDEAAAKGLNNTLMEKCVLAHPEAVVLLEEQYRMNRLIMGFPSAEFYGNRLKAAHGNAAATLFSGDNPLVFIDTAGCGYTEKVEGTSISNPEEAAFLFDQLRAYVTQLEKFYSRANFPWIGVISPYKHQVEIMKHLLENDQQLNTYAERISVNTIDSFQGQERDAVFISMTRSNANSTIGFLSEIRRMNVALTRAKKKLVVTGDSATLSQFKFYADFISYAQENEAYKSAWELMEE